MRHSIPSCGVYRRWIALLYPIRRRVPPVAHCYSSIRRRVPPVACIAMSHQAAGPPGLALLFPSCGGNRRWLAPCSVPSGGARTTSGLHCLLPINAA
ncbi:hypothetical protein AVEN_22587-1 [Araneus ventricosus]|uniref:Uncharacterized protein n=1 Tax=Araneus ventricosus TaxID=182803 RepID=A0A4Y2E7K2_ARAVE|nr:hypothetical protein AVEN_22587-1 [Araneus ventricosus]